MNNEKNILVIDIGNSYIKIGLFDNNEKLLRKHLFKTNRIIYSKTWLNRMFKENFSKFDIHCAILGSVVPKQTKNFIKSILEVYKVNPYLLDEKTKTSFTLKNINRSDLGDDIIALSEYCYRQNKTSIGVSFGTAAFALYIENGDLKGASIGPGIGTSFAKLLNKASLLNIDKIDKNSNLIYGTNTKQALDAGFNIIRSGFVMSFYHNANKNNKKINCIITGGEANKLSVDFDYSINENAILLGFKYIYDLNNK